MVIVEWQTQDHEVLLAPEGLIMLLVAMNTLLSCPHPFLLSRLITTSLYKKSDIIYNCKRYIYPIAGSVPRENMFSHFVLFNFILCF